MKKCFLPLLACCALSVTTLTSCTSAEKDPTRSFEEIVDTTKEVNLHDLGTTMDKAYMNNKGVEINGSVEITSTKDVVSLLPFTIQISKSEIRKGLPIILSACPYL